VSRERSWCYDLDEYLQVERKIRDLQALKTELDNLIDQCSCGTVAECRIIEALSPAV